MFRALKVAQYSLALKFSKQTKQQRFTQAAALGIGLGAVFESFMIATNFYDVTQQITARRWHEQEQRKALLDEVLEEQKAAFFQRQLERRADIQGGKDHNLSPEDVKNVPSFYNYIRDTVYPSEEGWGPFKRQRDSV
ncbi:hypothetical protein DIPPA_64948 [Diplonema papillatum]|nr:hypothetical protein DIPPA_64948 [Diplonema papillatum]